MMLKYKGKKLGKKVEEKHQKLEEKFYNSNYEIMGQRPWLNFDDDFEIFVVFLPKTNQY